MEVDPCCPLCQKVMTTTEVSDLTTEMLDEIRRLPETTASAERQLRAEQTKYEQLLGLQPLTVRLADLKVRTPKLRTELASVQEQLSAALAESETIEMLQAEPQARIEMATRILGDMSTLDTAAKEMARLRTEIDRLRADLPANQTTLSMDEAQRQRGTIAEQLDSCRARTAQLQSDYDRDQTAVNKMRDMRSKLQDEKIQLQSDQQALAQIRERYEECVRQIGVRQTELAGLMERQKPLRLELAQTMQDKERVVADQQTVLRKAQDKMNELVKINDRIKR